MSARAVFYADHADGATPSFRVVVGHLSAANIVVGHLLLVRGKDSLLGGVAQLDLVAIAELGPVAGADAKGGYRGGHLVVAAAVAAADPHLGVGGLMRMGAGVLAGLIARFV